MLTVATESPAMQAFDFNRMRAERKAAKLTQAQAAKKAGMSQGSWSDIEAGERENLTVETLVRIAAAIGCNAADLLTPPEE